MGFRRRSQARHSGENQVPDKTMLVRAFGGATETFLDILGRKQISQAFPQLCMWLIDAPISIGSEDRGIEWLRQVAAARQLAVAPRTADAMVLEGQPRVEVEHSLGPGRAALKGVQERAGP